MHRDFFQSAVWTCTLVILMAFLPFWAVCLILLLPLFYFKTFYPAIIVGFLMDVFYGHAASFIPFPFLIFSALLALLIPVLKRKLIFLRAA